MPNKLLVQSGKPALLSCDGACSKAWGVSLRPREHLSADPDDYAFLSDQELGDAPADPGTYEGGHAKPASPSQMNKWCSRECERSLTTAPGKPVSLPDFSVRRFNQPWKHSKAST